MTKITSRLTLLLAILLLPACSFSMVTKGDPIEEKPQEKSALLVIDIQEGITGELSTHFMFNGYVKQADEFVANVNRAVVAAGDMPVVYIYHEETHPVLAFISGHQFDPGAPGAAIDSRVNIISDNLFTKTLMDGFSNPELDRFLRANHINHLSVTGLDAAHCVDRTSRAAMQRGYGVTAISDALVSISPSRRGRSRKKYAKRGMGVITVAEFEKR